MLDICPQQMQKYEGGKDRISAYRLSQISKALEVPESYFFQADAPASDAASACEPGGTNLTREFTIPLLRACYQLSEFDRARVVVYAETLGEHTPHSQFVPESKRVSPAG